MTAQPELTIKFTTGKRVKVTPAELAELRAILGVPAPVPQLASPLVTIGAPPMPNFGNIR